MSQAVMAAVLALFLADPQVQTQDRPEADILAPIDVTGRLAGMDLETRVDSYVNAVAAPVGNWGPARWDRRRPLCIGAANFQPEAARQVIDRIAALAAEVDLRIAPPGCRRTQVLIIASNDGAAAATAAVTLNRRLFAPQVDDMAFGRGALEAFQTGQRPIRWWQVNTPVDPDTGQRLVRLPGENMGDRNPLKQNEKPDNVSLKPFASRLYGHYRNDLRNVVIIVDTEQLGGVSFDQWADYVAMLALAQVATDVDVRGHDSILALFDETTAVAGLTDWDRAYLDALYRAQLDSQSQNARLGAVERLMERTAARSQAAVEQD